VIVGLLLAAVIVVGAGHYYVWRRLVRDTISSRRGRRVGAWILAVLPTLTIAALVGTETLPRPVATALAWPGYLWLALFFYLLIVLGLLELPALATKVILRRRSADGHEPGRTTGTAPVSAAEQPLAEPWSYQSRRRFLGRVVAVTAGATAAGLVGYGVGQALGPPRIKRIQIPLAKLPRGADGLRVALVSDIHLGPLNGVGRTRRIVEIVNGLDADLVAIVGDLVDGSVAELGPAAAPLGGLHSRLGTFFVTGNHEYYSGYQQWLDEVGRLGMRALRNERVELPGGVDLAGVNDATGAAYHDSPDYDAALRGRDPSRPVVLLAHQPVQAHEAARHGVDLQLSGHTHGGQITPFQLIVRASGQPVVSGLGEVDGMPVYVTNGAGFWGPPVRVGAPPDVTLVELRAP
jgi:predicted MPP superfamily phosphohydrolase